ncbi:MAG: D-ribose pyranase [Enterobacteriaceae bacterium]
MKKGAVLQARLSALIASLGHTDQLAVADAGLPVPASTERLDLALTRGIPSFMQVVETIASEMQIEGVIMAREIKEANPDVHEQIMKQITQWQQQQGNSIQITYVSHERFKTQTADCRAVVRSGECTPYANIILCSGVVF